MGCFDVEIEEKSLNVVTTCMFVTSRTVFNVEPRTHQTNLEAAEQVVLDGTSKWSCKIQVTGTSHLTVLSCWMEVTVHELTFLAKNISIDCQISDC